MVGDAPALAEANVKNDPEAAKLVFNAFAEQVEGGGGDGGDSAPRLRRETTAGAGVESIEVTLPLLLIISMMGIVASWYVTP